MFFPVESLKRGGRFYLCWVADSWPLRFATITQRQLWSQDIRKICDDLMEVVINESGAPTRRFSLRLSSQLMRGLVRLYQRKVTIFLSELCMLNAYVTKHVNKKFVIHEEVVSVPQTLPQLPRVVPELPEPEERVEEMIQNSGNVVANIEDITLKEATLPEVQPLLNDNFGDPHPDRTLELMLAADRSAPQHSLELDVSTDKSHDKTRLPAPDVLMERISEHELSLFSKSHGEEHMADITKEIPGIPDLPEFPLPALPAPPPEVEKETQNQTEQEVPQAPVEDNRQKEPEEIVLEELEDPQPPTKKRRMKSKIVDKNTKLSSNYLRARIANCAVELRCEEASDDIIRIIVPAHCLLGRAAHAGARQVSALGSTITRLFTRNLGPVTCPLADREMEQVLLSRMGRSFVRSELEKIDEEVEPIVTEPQPMEPPVPMEPPDRVVPEVTVTDVTAPEVTLPEDIAELPTQVIETLSQQRKRTADQEFGGTSKASRRSGYKTFRQSQGPLTSEVEVPFRPSQGPLTSNVEVPEYVPETNKENVSDNIPQEYRQSASGDKDLVTVMSMLQEAGLEDQPRAGPEPSPRASQRARKSGSENTETPLGSLDRTKVSLGDSEKTTDSVRFISDNWGTRGTMIKIIVCLKAGVRPLDVRALVARGPVLPNLKRIIAARCFTSILKLIQHGFIKVIKDPETLEIRDIILGAKFDAP